MEILKIRKQLSFEEYLKLMARCSFDSKCVLDKIAAMSNDNKYTKGKNSLFLTINNWFIKDEKRK
mgnify:CR=1 FL=1